MEQDIHNLLEKTSYHSEHRLSDAIWHMIVTRERRRARLKRIGYGIASIVSIATLVPTGITMTQQAVETGFTQYAGLLFSDVGSLTSMSKEILYALGEALPVVSIAACLVLVIVFGMSLRQLLRVQLVPQTI